MRPEFYPEVVTEISQTPKGRQLVRYTVDTLPRHADKIYNSLKHSEGVVRPSGNDLSVVRLGLYIPQPESANQETAINIIGSGRNMARVFVEGVQKHNDSSKAHPLFENFYWQVFLNLQHAQLVQGNSRLVEHAMRPEMLVGVPTTELFVFGVDSVVEVGALREYYIILSQNGEQIKATVDTKDNEHNTDENVRIAYVPARDDKPKSLLSIRRAVRDGLHHWEFR